MARVRKRDERVERAALDRIAGLSELTKRQRKHGCACLTLREYEALYWGTWAISPKPEGEPEEEAVQKFVAYKVGVSQSTISRWFRRLDILLKAMTYLEITIGWVLTEDGWWLNVPTTGNPPEHLKPIPQQKIAKPTPILHISRALWYDGSSTKKSNKERPF